MDLDVGAFFDFPLPNLPPFPPFPPFPGYTNKRKQGRLVSYTDSTIEWEYLTGALGSFWPLAAKWAERARNQIDGNLVTLKTNQLQSKRRRDSSSSSCCCELDVRKSHKKQILKVNRKKGRLARSQNEHKKPDQNRQEVGSQAADQVVGPHARLALLRAIWPVIDGAVKNWMRKASEYEFPKSASGATTWKPKSVEKRLKKNSRVILGDEVKSRRNWIAKWPCGRDESYKTYHVIYMSVVLV